MKRTRSVIRMSDDDVPEFDYPEQNSEIGHFRLIVTDALDPGVRVEHDGVYLIRSDSQNNAWDVFESDGEYIDTLVVTGTSAISLQRYVEALAADNDRSQPRRRGGFA